MPVRFAYQRTRSTIYRTLFRPVARVYLRASRGPWLPHVMLVDSGADFTLLPRTIGQILGLRKSSADQWHRAGGVTGEIWVTMRRMRMRIGPHEFTADVGWAQEDGTPLLLGRADVFELFDVRFRQSDRVVDFLPSRH